jgi:hypothetical protein
MNYNLTYNSIFVSNFDFDFDFVQCGIADQAAPKKQNFEGCGPGGLCLFTSSDAALPSSLSILFPRIPMHSMLYLSNYPSHSTTIGSLLLI